MSDSVAQAELKSFVRRIESVEDEINALNSDKSEIYKEAKSGGFDTKILRKVVAKRRIGAVERDEQDAIFDLYWDALHDASTSVVRAHVENIEEFDAETGEITEPQSAPQAVQMHVQAVAAPNAQPDVSTSLAGAEGIADQQPIQPETAEQYPSIEGVKAPMMVAADANAGGDHEEAVVDTLISTEAAPQEASGMENDSTVMTRADASGLAFGSDVETVAPSNLTSFAPKPLRPYCQNPGNGCGGMGRKHCVKCESGRAELGAA